MGQASTELTQGVRRPAALRLLSDDRLARRAAEGDRGAFAVIFERHHQGLYRYCRAILRHDEDARDALQTTFTRAIAALDGETRSVAIKPWLYRIAHNETISLLRRRRPCDALEAQPEAASAAPAPEDRVLTSERMRQLLADLEQLPERQRWALLLRELNDLTYADIAAAITTTEQAARQSVYEARVMLMELKEGREMPCADVRRLISERDGRLLRPRKVRAHLKACEPCTEFRSAIGTRRADLGALAPPLPAAAAAAVLNALLGGGGGGGVGGGGLLAALSAGKGVVASAGSKGLATAAAVTIAGGTLVTTGGQLPRLGRGERDAKRPASLETRAQLRAPATAPAMSALTFVRLHDAPAATPPAVEHRSAAATPTLAEQAPHDRTPVSPAPVPAPVTPTTTAGPDTGDGHAPGTGAGDTALPAPDHGAGGTPRAQQGAGARGSSAADDAAVTTGDGSADHSAQSPAGPDRGARGSAHDETEPPAHASSSAHAPRSSDGHTAALESHLDAGRENAAAAMARHEDSEPAPPVAPGQGRRDADAHADASRPGDKADTHDQRERTPSADQADGRSDPPGHDDSTATHGQSDPPGHNDSTATHGQSDPPGHNDSTATHGQSDPPGHDASPGPEELVGRPAAAERAPVTEQRTPAKGGSSKSAKSSL